MNGTCLTNCMDGYVEPLCKEGLCQYKIVKYMEIHVSTESILSSVGLCWENCGFRIHVNISAFFCMKLTYSREISSKETCSSRENYSSYLMISAI